MDNIFINILSCIVTVIILPLITLLGSKLIKWISKKIDDENLEKILIKATNIVLDAVKYVLQTYVDNLKKEGKFTKDAQLIAFNKAKEIVLSQFNEEIKSYIKDNFGDIDSWVDVQIEASINNLKNISPIQN